MDFMKKESLVLQQSNSLYEKWKDWQDDLLIPYLDEP